MSFLCGCIQLLLAVLNVCLSVSLTFFFKQTQKKPQQITGFAFAIVGFLMKFNPQFMVEKISSIINKSESGMSTEVVRLLQDYGVGFSIIVIVIGLFIGIIALLGALALICKNKCLTIVVG